MKIAEADLPTKTKNAVVRAIGPDVTLDDLAQWSDDDLAKIPFVGRLGIQRIRTLHAATAPGNLDTANITTAALEKRIAELETNIISWRGERDDWREAAAQSERELTTERKRREECEAVLREVANAPNRIAENSRIIADYFGAGN